jgi:beta-fructofuranosidase
MNDPNGPIFFNNRYHMFHQYNPQAAVWGNMNWAHATSPDMIHWQHEPLAISPTPNGYDRDGVFSGSAVLDNGVPTVIYTGVLPPTPDFPATLRDGVHTWREVQCLAVAQDENLGTWKKIPDPVIAAPPAGLDITGFRDPYIWRENNSWMLILGSGVHNKGGAILLYTSPDLRHWTYLHPLVEGTRTNASTSANAVDTGDMWECPDFFPLGAKHVLLISTMGKVLWKVGAYANQRFTPEKEGVADWGSFYAAKSMRDRSGNRILWGWIPETRPEKDFSAAGWAGAMALPRVLSLSPQNDLQSDVSQAVEQLRTASVTITHETSGDDRKQILDSLRIHDLSAEISLTIQPKTSEPSKDPHTNSDAFALRLQSEAGEDFVTIRCTSNSSSREIHVNNITAPLAGSPTSPIHLRVFLDASVLEVFANQTTALTARIYQAPSTPLRLILDAHADLISLNVWQIRPISNDRLTASLCS